MAYFMVLVRVLVTVLACGVIVISFVDGVWMQEHAVLMHDGSLPWSCLSRYGVGAFRLALSGFEVM